ncbi:histidine phosphatase family protein [Undibacterium sp. SXout20W]|uniref:histidine phosphatase family protein n=1 Tax=Undibacterium sp. SXout20W TaxID=3413051 RepID=UPI003BF0A086
MKLYLIRHTAPVIGTSICYGQSEIAVRDQDVGLLAAHLQGRWPDSVPVYSSPLSRCLKLAQKLHPHPIVDDRLMELNFGDWEMQAWDHIPRSEIDSWAADVVNYAPGGNETLLQMAARVLAFVSDLQKNAHEQSVLVCHAGVIKILLALQPGNTSVDLAQRVAQLAQKIEFASCTEIKILL